MSEQPGRPPKLGSDYVAEAVTAGFGFALLTLGVLAVPYIAVMLVLDASAWPSGDALMGFVVGGAYIAGLEAWLEVRANRRW